MIKLNNTANRLVGAALFFALSLAGCGKSSERPSGSQAVKGSPGNSVGSPSSGNSPSSDNESSAKRTGSASSGKTTSVPWKGKMKTVIGDWKALKQLVDSHRGKVVVLDMWSTWCSPCKEELPGLARLQKKYGDKIICVAVSLDSDGSDETKPAKTKDKVERNLRTAFGKALKESEALHPSFRLFISSEADEDVYENAGFDSVPTIFVYSKSGKRIKIDANSTGAEKISYEKYVDPVVEKLMKEPDPKNGVK